MINRVISLLTANWPAVRLVSVRNLSKLGMAAGEKLVTLVTAILMLSLAIAAHLMLWPPHCSNIWTSLLVYVASLIVYMGGFMLYTIEMFFVYATNV